MKQKKYSESKIKTAQKFLSKYDLTFDDLDEPQKKAVVRQAYGQKYLILCLVVFTFGLITSIVGTYLTYNRTHTYIDKIVELSASGEVINLDKYGAFCFEKGSLVGMHSSCVLYTLLFIITLPLILKVKHQILDAFLPSLKQPSDGNKNPSN